MATKTRSSLWLLGAISGALLLGVVSYKATHCASRSQGLGAAATGQAEASTNDAEPSPAEIERTMAQLRQQAEVVASQRERRARTPPADGRGFPKETLALAQKTFDEMLAARGLVSTQEQRAAAARRLLASPRALDLVYRTSTEPDFARQAFGDQQAEARYFSLVVLEEAAKDGHRERLEEALQTVRRSLLSAEGFDVGRSEDFRGLLTAYAVTAAPDDLNAETLKSLGYDRGMPREMKQIYYETVFSVIWKREGLAVAETRFKEIFPEG
jgi:hypothetical protein